MGGSQANKERCSGATTLNNKLIFEDCQTLPLLKPHETSIVDSGCTGHFLLVNAPCLNKVKSQNPLTVRLPNGATMESSHTAALEIPELNKSAAITCFLWNGKPLFTFGWATVQRGIHSHFQERFGHNLQFSGASNFERRSRLGNWTLADKPEKVTPTTTTGCSK
jgi:hypothetical protein